MSIHYDVQILRSKLIAMTRLTQRTVDYSIKAMQLGRPELCRAVHNSRDEMNSIACWIATHGRKLLEIGNSGDADSRFACAALRISAALEAAHHAAVEIAQQIEARFEAGWAPVSSELEDAGQFVNSLLRLCVLSLLNRDTQHAKDVLHNDGVGHSLDLAIYLAHPQLSQRASSQARFELAVCRCLEGIAGQTREIADAIILWLDENWRENSAGGSAVHTLAQHTARLANGICQVTVSAMDSPCKAPASSGAISPREAHRLKAEDGRVSVRGIAEALPTDDAAQTRLTGLQQRVCELLVKNQQLRMALMAERAVGRQDHPS